MCYHFILSLGDIFLRMFTCPRAVHLCVTNTVSCDACTSYVNGNMLSMMSIMHLFVNIRPIEKFTCALCCCKKHYYNLILRQVFLIIKGYS